MSSDHHNPTRRRFARIQPTQRLPDLLQSVNLKHVKLDYHYLVTHLLTLCLGPMTYTSSGSTSSTISSQSSRTQSSSHSGQQSKLMTRPRSVFYLVDYSCYRPPPHLQVKFDRFMEHSRLTGDFNDSSLEFQQKIMERSRLGKEMVVPQAMYYLLPLPSMAAAKDEAKQVMFGALDNLFANTKINSRAIRILVVNCSLFNHTPSLSAMIVNMYKLRGNVRSFNLGGMGCTAGVIAIDLAKDMLQVHMN